MKERLRIRLINRLKVRTAFTSSSAPSLSKENQQADFINCVEFGKLAEFAEKYFRQGMRVLVSGRLQTGSYVNKDGQRVYTTEVILDDQEFADSKGAASDMSGYGQSAPSQRPAPTSAIGDGFMNIPDGVEDEGLPFN